MGWTLLQSDSDGRGRIAMSSQITSGVSFNFSYGYYQAGTLKTITSYAPQGQLSQYSYGNGVWRQATYNSRLQMSSNQQLLNGVLTWMTTAAGNNGNLQSA